MDCEHIRNFSIIAHIDHRKTTLSDRLLHRTGTIATRDMSDQLLDKFEADFEAKGKPALQKLGAQANDLAARAYTEGKEKGVPAVKGLVARLIERLRKK